MPYPSLKQVKAIGDYLKVNWEVLEVKDLQEGMIVELEHGIQRGLRHTNVTSDDLILTAKIALAHIHEFPDYYDRLEKMEEKAKRYWKFKTKPNIFLFPV
jgi:hypothetical protein